METILSDVEQHIITTVKSHEWDKAKQIIDWLRDKEVAKQALEEARKRSEEAERQLANLTGTVEPPQDFKGRRIRLKVTYGSIDNNYLLVTRALDDRVLKASETLDVHVPATGESFATGIYTRNKHLDERHKVGRFFRATGVKAGDFVLLEEIAPGKWRLIKDLE
jgi:hypothetical protein